MPLDLSSVDAKLGRAIEHAKAVENEIKTWASGKPYSLSYETNADCTRYSTLIHFNKSVPLAPVKQWSLMVADSIHNFRCALDHLVYAAAIAESKQDPPPQSDKLMFPICDSKVNFDLDLKRRKLGDISAPMRAVFELFQPYNRPYPKLPPLLAMLRDFENADKHKLLRLLFTCVSTGDIGFTGPPLAGGTKLVFHANKGEITDGAEVVAFIFDRPTPQMRYDRSNFTMVFALPHQKAGDGVSDRDDATTLMELIGTEIRTVIDSVAGTI
jgi:hypothetical protein